MHKRIKESITESNSWNLKLHFKFRKIYKLLYLHDLD